MGGVFWKTAKKRLHRALFPPIWGGLEIERCIAPLSAPDVSHFFGPKSGFIFGERATPPRWASGRWGPAVVSKKIYARTN